MAVYVDLVFLLNLLIDGAVLKTTAWSRRVSVKPVRLFAASFIGAAYAVMMLYPSLSSLFTFVIKGLFSLVMIYVAFGFHSLQQFLRHLGAFYLVNFAAAGAVFAMHYYFMDSSEVLNGMIYTQSGGILHTMKVGMVFIVCSLAAGLWLYKAVMAQRQRQAATMQFMAQVEIVLAEQQICCEGLIDTGNQLTDPLSRLPVMVIEAELLAQWLPSSWLAHIKSGDMDALMQSLSTNDDGSTWHSRMRFVPYRGINRGSQFMLAFKPEQVLIRWNGGEQATDRVLIGLDGGTLSSEGSYRAIIHPALAGMAEQTA